MRVGRAIGARCGAEQTLVPLADVCWTAHLVLDCRLVDLGGWAA